MAWMGYECVGIAWLGLDGLVWGEWSCAGASLGYGCIGMEWLGLDCLVAQLFVLLHQTKCIVSPQDELRL